MQSYMVTCNNQKDISISKATILINVRYAINLPCAHSCAFTGSACLDALSFMSLLSPVEISTG